MYDDVNRYWLIQNRLKTIHRNLKGELPTVKPKRQSSCASDGPKKKYSKNVQDHSHFSDDHVNHLNSICKKDVAKIKELMNETIGHRNYLRSIGDSSVLKIYRKFSECDFVVCMIYNILFELLLINSNGIHLP